MHIEITPAMTPLPMMPMSMPNTPGFRPGALVYNGEVIRDRGEMLSLTDMWRAAGSDPQKRPSEWLRQEATQAFIEVVAASNMGTAHIIQTRRGNNGGTFAPGRSALPTPSTSRPRSICGATRSSASAWRAAPDR